MLAKASRLCFRVMPRALNSSPGGGQQGQQQQQEEDVEFTFRGEGHKSGDVGVCLKMKNDSEDSRTVDVHFTAVAAYNTGVPAADLKEHSEAPVIEPHAGRGRWLGVWLAVCLAGWLAVCLSGWLCVCLSGWVSVCLAGWLSGCLSG